MGSSFSSATTTSPSSPTAKVIATDGSLKEYRAPIAVSSVLGSCHQFFFVCSSDSLYFDDYIPSLALDSVLELNQIYFVLPVSKLEYRLSGSDMANLATTASSALARASSSKKKDGGRGRRTRVAPVANVVCQVDCAGDASAFVKNCVGKMEGEMRGARAFCNFRRGRLNTIEEI
ncbi:uncharacterized protein LOC109828198 [Asparagus officinalis]|nr:uncharacterized protein LOC109828198 [Asparagus officinalis]